MQDSLVFSRLPLHSGAYYCNMQQIHGLNCQLRWTHVGDKVSTWGVKWAFGKREWHPVVAPARAGPPPHARTHAQALETPARTRTPAHTRRVGSSWLRGLRLGEARDTRGTHQWPQPPQATSRTHTYAHVHTRPLVRLTRTYTHGTRALASHRRSVEYW